MWVKNGGHIHDAERIMRASATLTRLAEMQCSVEMSEREAKRVERQEATRAALVDRICAPYGFKAIHGGEPRGYIVKILFPDGKYNTWGGAEEGYGVP